MGLDTSHDAWHGAYSSFNRFRTNIAKAIGFNINEFEGYGGSLKFDNIQQPGIRSLINHSDCEGYLSPETCGQLAVELQELLDIEVKNDINSEFADHLKQFIAGCKDAHGANESIEFH